MKEYRRKNRDRLLEYSRNYNKEYFLKNKEREIKRTLTFYHSLRNQVLELLGNKCVYCGCTIKKALEINHKYGGGRQEFKRRNGSAFYLDILKGRRSIDDLELTCRVCNAVHYLKLKGIGDFKIIWKQNNKSVRSYKGVNHI